MPGKNTSKTQIRVMFFKALVFVAFFVFSPSFAEQTSSVLDNTKLYRQFLLIKENAKYDVYVTAPRSVFMGDHGFSDWARTLTRPYEDGLEIVKDLPPEVSKKILDLAVEKGDGVVDKIYNAREKWILPFYERRKLFDKDASGVMKYKITQEIKNTRKKNTALIIVTPHGQMDTILSTMTINYLDPSTNKHAFEERYEGTNEEYKAPRGLFEGNKAPVTLWIPEQANSNLMPVRARTVDVEGDWQGEIEIKAVANDKAGDQSFFSEMLEVAELNKILAFSPKVVMQHPREHLSYEKSINGRYEERAPVEKSGGKLPIPFSNALNGNIWLDFDQAPDTHGTLLERVYKEFWGMKIMHVRKNPLMPGSINHVAYANRKELSEALIYRNLVVQEDKLAEMKLRFVTGTVPVPNAYGKNADCKVIWRELAKLKLTPPKPEYPLFYKAE